MFSGWSQWKTNLAGNYRWWDLQVFPLVWFGNSLYLLHVFQQLVKKYAKIRHFIFREGRSKAALVIQKKYRSYCGASRCSLRATTSNDNMHAQSMGNQCKHCGPKILEDFGHLDHDIACHGSLNRLLNLIICHHLPMLASRLKPYRWGDLTVPQQVLQPLLVMTEEPQYTSVAQVDDLQRSMAHYLVGRFH